MADTGGIPAVIQLGPSVGEGGEGKVFSVVGSPDLLVKKYHKPPSVDKQSKIRAMAALSKSGLRDFAAWPITPYLERGQIAGFVMPRIADARDVHALYSPKARKQHFPNADWGHLVQAALNMAAAFHNVHELGAIIGDVNQSSVFVRKDMQVVLIDCDSMQFSANGQSYPCEVGVPIFTPPELQQQSLRNQVRTKNHDAFGLAVLIFHLLFLGRHPFAGRPLAATDLPIEKAIQEYRFAYSIARQTQLAPPPNTLAFSALPADIASLFERAFDGPAAKAGTRSSAAEWHGALTNLKKTLKRCVKEPSHKYPEHNSSCPWCRIENDTGVVLFQSLTRQAYAPPPPSPSGFTDTEVLWQAVLRAAKPQAQAEPDIVHLIAPTSPSKKARWLGVLWKVQHAVAAILGVGAFSSVLPSGNDAVGSALMSGGAIYGVSAFLLTRFKEADRRKILDDAKTAVAARDHFGVRWRNEASLEPYHAYMTSLAEVRKEHQWLTSGILDRIRKAKEKNERDLAAWRNKQSELARRIRSKADKSVLAQYPLPDDALAAAYDHLLAKHLDRHSLSNAQIPNIGPSRIAKLESYGVETAGDITKESVLLVPGFGEQLVAALVAWRKTVEKSFVFDFAKAQKGLESGAIKIAPPPRSAPLPQPEPHKLDEIRRLETELRAAPQKLEQMVRTISARQKRLMEEAQLIAQSWAQSQADAAAIKIFKAKT